jgi:N-acetylmuramoyl-L-alanine amidase
LAAGCCFASTLLPAATRHGVAHRSTAGTEKTVGRRDRAPGTDRDDGAAPGRVTGVRFWSLSGATRIAIEVDADYTLKSDRLQNPDRLFFDIVGVKPASRKIQTIAVGDTLLKQIRVAETQPGTTRIVLDLAGNADYTASRLTSPERLIIELRKGNGSPLDPPSPSGVETAKIEQPVLKTFSPPPATPRPAPANPQRIDSAPPRIIARVDSPVIPAAKVSAPPAGAAVREPRPSMLRETPVENGSVTRKTPPSAPALPARTSGDPSLTRVLGLKLGRVVIDAGHGGHDSGTRGDNGLLEKDLVLDVALRLASLIETRLASEVVLTRSDDTFIALDQRTQIANDRKADLFISIHANSSPVKSTSGVETYYLNFTTVKSALEVAARENASSERSIYDLKDLLQKIALKDKVEESREFASRVQTSMAALSSRSNSNSRNRGVKKAPFVVLIGASMPSILAEIGFLTNPRDESMMKKPEYRQKIAEALFRGVAQYASGLSHFQVAQRKQPAE